MPYPLILKNDEINSNKENVETLIVYTFKGSLLCSQLLNFAIHKKEKKFINLFIGQRRSRPSSTDLTNMSNIIRIKSILTHEQITKLPKKLIR